MNVSQVRPLSAIIVEEQNESLNIRVQVLAVGIISSCLVLALIQPPASIVLAAAILTATFAITFSSNFPFISRAVHVVKKPAPDIYFEPTRTPMEWRNPVERLHIPIVQRHHVEISRPREPVGRRESNSNFLKKPLPEEDERVQARRKFDTNRERVPVGER